MEAAEPTDRKPIRGTFFGCCASAGNHRAKSMAHRAKLPSLRLFFSPSHLMGCACFVPEPGQNIHVPLPKKKASGASKSPPCFECALPELYATMYSNR